MKVELLLAPDCPNASAARAVLTAALHRLGLDLPVRERVGRFASPTILVDGVDVMTNTTGAPSMQGCRLEMPTEARVLAALQHRGSRSGADGAV
jgi:pyridoxal biosynthesis lyase PdxS